MSVSGADLQTALLRVLAQSRADKRLGFGRHYLAEALHDQLPAGQRLSQQQIMAAIWSLVGQGLAYIDFSQPAPENWELALTDTGSAALTDAAVNPDSAGEYLTSLGARIPDASPIVLDYVREAITSYTSRCYLASAVMLGVASEAAFLEMAQAFGRWQSLPQSEKFRDVIENPRASYIAKFGEFRKRIEPLKPLLPDELADGMALTLDSVLDVLRIQRNDAGHPTGRQLSRDDVFISLQMLARYLEKLYRFKAFFEVAATT